MAYSYDQLKQYENVPKVIIHEEKIDHTCISPTLLGSIIQIKINHTFCLQYYNNTTIPHSGACGHSIQFHIMPIM